MQHATELGEWIGAEFIRPGHPTDAIDGRVPQLVVVPGSAEEVAAVMRYATAHGLCVAARGGGTKCGWGNTPHALDLVLSLARLNRVTEHAWGDMTASAEAGCAIGALQATLAAHGQRLALDAHWPAQATIGGMLATGDSGALRLRYGGLRDLLIGITVVLPDGTIARSGGKVVKNVAGYDLPKLMTGALGTLGVIVAATFRLHPLPRTERTFSIATGDAAHAAAVMLAALDSALVPGAMQVRCDGSGAWLDFCFEGVEAAIDEQIGLLATLTGARVAQPADAAVWQAREALWAGDDPALVCKVAVLPSQAAQLDQLLRHVAGQLQLKWRLVLQAIGVGMLRLEGANHEVLLTALSTLRDELLRWGGSLVALGCPAAIKSRIDVWGAVGDDMALMRRVKAQFDPLGILNPGRFVGGI
ncbi:MAG TPA: FAD-binding oxidoreductase [Roseiflexaceae bacterium]|nr:FAD-binding oxidoreductase [Roseiflexaceae bacterium]HMP41307.1 FAD-binding oxidoreductase [Roseiflexaceae bacterium]